MRLIEIKALENGAHCNNNTSAIFSVPDGWAVIPDDMECANFPIGEITVDESTPPVVTSWTPGVMPEPVEAEPSQLDIIEAQVVYTAMMTGTLLEEEVYEEED